jgi:hypothetical protein
MSRALTVSGDYIYRIDGHKTILKQNKCTGEIVASLLIEGYVNLLDIAAYNDSVLALDENWNTIHELVHDEIKFFDDVNDEIWRRPRGIAIDKTTGNIYISNQRKSEQHNVQIVDKSFHVDVIEDKSLQSPTCLAIDSSFVYVVGETITEEGECAYICIFDKNTKQLIRKWQPIPAWDSDSIPLGDIGGISVDDHFLYFVDKSCDDVLVYDKHKANAIPLARLHEPDLVFGSYVRAGIACDDSFVFVVGESSDVFIFYKF